MNIFLNELKETWTDVKEDIKERNLYWLYCDLAYFFLCSWRDCSYHTHVTKPFVIGGTNIKVTEKICKRCGTFQRNYENT